MLQTLIKNHPVRKSNEQKENFRNFAIGYAKERGLDAKVEKLGDHKNVVVGNPDSAKVVLTAHYDTPNASLFPNIMIPRNKILFFAYQFLPITLMLIFSLVLSAIIGFMIFESREIYMISFIVLYFGSFFLLFKAFVNKNNHNDNTSGVAVLFSIMDKLPESKIGDVAFIFFDNEEKGKLGSKAYCKEHKEMMESKLLVNFDCVGNGKDIVFIAKPNAEQSQIYSKLVSSFVEKDGFSLHFYPMKGSESNSDYKNFPMGVGCMACKKTKKGLLYTPYIHTRKDVVCEEENIEFIASGIIGFLA